MLAGLLGSKPSEALEPSAAAAELAVAGGHHSESPFRSSKEITSSVWEAPKRHAYRIFSNVVLHSNASLTFFESPTKEGDNAAGAQLPHSLSLHRSDVSVAIYRHGLESPAARPCDAAVKVNHLVTVWFQTLLRDGLVKMHAYGIS